MKYLLAALLVALIVIDTFSIEASIATGISVKNLFLYLAMATLLLRIVRGDEEFRVRAPVVVFTSLLVLVYALGSMIVARFLIDYNRYDLLEATIRLKADMLDPLLILVAFLYATETIEDGMWFIRALLLTMFFANAVTLADALGGFGWLKVGEDGRVQGALGEQNQYAAYIVTFLPAMFVAAFTGQGLARRLFWLVGVLISLAALLMTVSRGAFLALLAMIPVAVAMYRGVLKPMQILRWGLLALLFASPLLVLVGIEYGDLLKERVLDQTFSSSIGDASSGRTAIWFDVLGRMMQSPLSFITGFGWQVYLTMGFIYITHNHYLDQWFNLGLVGLVGFLVILFYTASATRRGAGNLDSTPRLQLAALPVALTGLGVAIFFVNLFTPWPYIWAYIGVCLRMASLETELPLRTATRLRR